MKRAYRVAFAAALSLFLAGFVFTAASAVIWAEHAPAWQLRVSGAVWLAGALLTAAAAGLWLKQHRK